MFVQRHGTFPIDAHQASFTATLDNSQELKQVIGCVRHHSKLVLASQLLGCRPDKLGTS